MAEHTFRPDQVVEVVGSAGRETVRGRDLPNLLAKGYKLAPHVEAAGASYDHAAHVKKCEAEVRDANKKAAEARAKKAKTKKADAPAPD